MDSKKGKTSSGVGTPSKTVQLPITPATAAPPVQLASARDIFLLCLTRASNLLKIHQAAHGKPRTASFVPR